MGQDPIVRSVLRFHGEPPMRQPHVGPRQLKSIPDAAAYLQVSQKTVRRYIAAGRLPAYRAGPKFLRVDQADLDALLQRVPTAGNAA